MSAPDKGEVELAKMTNNSAGNLNSSVDEGKGRVNTMGSHTGADGVAPQTALKIEHSDLKSDFFPIEQQVEVK